MKVFAKKIGVIFYGPPGSGKGTQAKLLSDRLDLFHFNSGDFLRKILYNPKNQKNKTILREKKLNETGMLNTEIWVMDVISKRYRELIKLGQSIITEGYPRTVLETFGGKKREGGVDIFGKGYGKNNVFIFALKIPEKESINRNSGRMTCSICKISLMAASGIKFKDCPLCGGKIMKRKDDNPGVIKMRLKEYKERTTPIFKELKKRKYKIYEIDGTPAPFKIHEKIISCLK